MSQLYRCAGKRLLDLSVAAFLLVVMSPALTVLALAVRLKLGPPVLFRQERPGFNQEIFTLFKFRTMKNTRSESGTLLPDGERLTGLGKLLRKTSLDELPELWNVLCGDMSLVGPRPLLIRYNPYYTQEERLRFTVRPGITGLAQVSGRNDLDWDSRLAADIRYVQSLSLLLDMRILLLTLRRVVSSHGVQINPGAEMLDLDEERKRRMAV